MAQLDTAGFMPQVFWLVLVFVVYYLVVSKNIVPALSTMLKVRAKKLSQGQGVLGEMATEKAEVGETYDHLVFETLKASGELLQKASASERDFTGGAAWRLEQKKADVVYLESVGKMLAVWRKVEKGLLNFSPSTC